jgi:hypothetical protein
VGASRHRPAPQRVGERGGADARRARGGQGARETFIKNHQMVGFEKAEWKDDAKYSQAAPRPTPHPTARLRATNRRGRANDPYGARALSGARGARCGRAQEFRKAEYAKAMGKTAELLPLAEAALKELEPLIHSAEACAEGGLSYDDIDLFARLRSVTIVKGLTLPAKVKAYMEHFSHAADIPLYTGLAK